MQNNFTDNIVELAGNMFLRDGVRSVTMDDVAQGLGISKKTLYQHFENKEALIRAVGEYSFQRLKEAFERTGARESNPILSTLNARFATPDYLRAMIGANILQMEKYYPELFREIASKHDAARTQYILNNLESGIRQGLYRGDVNRDFIVDVFKLISDNLFKMESGGGYSFDFHERFTYFLEYHLRAISTEKGLKVLESQLEKEKKEKEQK